MLSTQRIIASNLQPLTTNMTFTGFYCFLHLILNSILPTATNSEYNLNFDISRTLFLFTAWRYQEYLKSYSYVWTGTLYRVSLHMWFKYLMVFLLHVRYLPVQVKGLTPTLIGYSPRHTNTETESLTYPHWFIHTLTCSGTHKGTHTNMHSCSDTMTLIISLANKSKKLNNNKRSTNCCAKWHLWQFFLFVLAYIEDFYGYDVIMMSFREKEMCKIAPLPIGQCHLPKWVTWLCYCFDWLWLIKKVTWPNSKAIAVFNWSVLIRWFYLIDTREFLVI